MERFKESEFSGWDNLKYPLWAISAFLLIVGGIGWFIAAGWNSL